MFAAKWFRKRGRLQGLFCLLALGCGSESNDRPHEDIYFRPADLEQGEIPSFEEFREYSKVSDVEGLYLVEWDIPIRSEAELRDYYDARYHGRLDKSAVKLTPSEGPDTGQCDVPSPPSNCIDDIYYQNEQLGLRYCVSDDFGSDKPDIVAAMEQAGHAWQQVANVWFQYVPTHDEECSSLHWLPSSVDFKVSPWFNGGACSFWPYSKRACYADTLVYNANTDFSPNTMTGVMIHELGHILGFHHEHMRADVASSSCNAYEMRYLTDWDANSVMGYPAVWGGCAIGGGNVITEQDGIGARELYGIPAAWYVPIIL